MNNKIFKFLRQPLLHFLLIGALIFALYYYINPSGSEKEAIVIDDEQVSRMLTLFEKKWNRPPSEEEMKGLLDVFIRTEVYYRKALQMNLDHNDEIIRRRLNQKLEFITNDLATMKEPSDEELKGFYNTNKEKYKLPPQYSFSHIYFNPDNRAQIKKDAEVVLESLPANDTELSELIKKGDAFPFAYHFDNLNIKDIAKEMGDPFADNLESLPVKKWSGPILSGYGLHLIFITEKKMAKEPAFAELREDLLKDYQYQLQLEYNDNLYTEFKKDFDIRLEINDPQHDKELLGQLIGINEK